MKDEEVLKNALVAGQSEIESAYKSAALGLMESKTIETDSAFLGEFTALITSRYLMNMEVMDFLPTTVNEMWRLFKKLKISKEFKDYLIGKKKVVKKIMLERPKRQRLVFVNPNRG